MFFKLLLEVISIGLILYFISLFCYLEGKSPDNIINIALIIIILAYGIKFAKSSMKS